MVFEKMEGGTLFETIERRRHLTEQEASLVIRDIATALHFLHQKGEHHLLTSQTAESVALL